MAFFSLRAPQCFFEKKHYFIIIEFRSWKWNVGAKKFNLSCIYFCHLSYPAFSDFLAQSMTLAKLCTCIGGKRGRKVFCLLMEPICLKFKGRGEGNQSACWRKSILFTTRIFVLSGIFTAYYRYKKRFFVKNRTATVLRGTVCGGKAEKQTLQKCSRKILFFFGFYEFSAGKLNVFWACSRGTVNISSLLFFLWWALIHASLSPPQTYIMHCNHQQFLEKISQIHNSPI